MGAGLVGDEVGMPAASNQLRQDVGGVRDERHRLTDADAWSDLLRAAKPDEGDDWPLPRPSTPDADDFFRLPPEKPKRPNPFGDD